MVFLSQVPALQQAVMTGVRQPARRRRVDPLLQPSAPPSGAGHEGLRSSSRFRETLNKSSRSSHPPDRGHQVVGIGRQWHHLTAHAAFFCSPIQGAPIHGTCSAHPWRTEQSRLGWGIADTRAVRLADAIGVWMAVFFRTESAFCGFLSKHGSGSGFGDEFFT